MNALSAFKICRLLAIGMKTCMAGYASFIGIRTLLSLLKSLKLWLVRASPKPPTMTEEELRAEYARLAARDLEKFREAEFERITAIAVKKARKSFNKCYIGSDIAFIEPPNHSETIALDANRAFRRLADKRDLHYVNWLEVETLVYNWQDDHYISEHPFKPVLTKQNTKIFEVSAEAFAAIVELEPKVVRIEIPKPFVPHVDLRPKINDFMAQLGVTKTAPLKIVQDERQFRHAYFTLRDLMLKELPCVVITYNDAPSLAKWANEHLKLILSWFEKQNKLPTDLIEFMAMQHQQAMTSIKSEGQLQMDSLVSQSKIDWSEIPDEDITTAVTVPEKNAPGLVMAMRKMRWAYTGHMVTPGKGTNKTVYQCVQYTCSVCPRLAAERLYLAANDQMKSMLVCFYHRPPRTPTNLGSVRLHVHGSIKPISVKVNKSVKIDHDRCVNTEYDWTDHPAIYSGLIDALQVWKHLKN